MKIPLQQKPTKTIVLDWATKPLHNNDK